MCYNQYMRIFVPREVKKLSNIFGDKSPLFIVGGYVRNCLMHRRSNDIDLTSCLVVNQVNQLLKNTDFASKTKSAQWGSMTIIGKKNKYDYTAFRKDIYIGDGSHTPQNVILNASIVDDSARRDFTINALYYDIGKKILIDFYGGVDDIKTKTLRAIGEADKLFKDDAERILRLLRLSVQLNFTIEEKTYLAMQDNVKGLANLSHDRVIREFIKILFASKKNITNNALRIFDRLDMWKYLGTSKMFSRLNGLSQNLYFYNNAKFEDKIFAFCLDIYKYLAIDKKELIKEFLGKTGLNCTTNTKEDIYKMLRSFELLTKNKKPIIPTREISYLFKKYDNKLYKEAKRWKVLQ